MQEIIWMLKEKILYIMSINNETKYNYPVLYTMLILGLLLLLVPIVNSLIRLILRKLFNWDKVEPSNNNDINTTYTTNMPYENTQNNNHALYNEVYSESDSIDIEQIYAILVGKKKKSKLVSNIRIYDSLFSIIFIIALIIFITYRYNEMKTLYKCGMIDSFDIEPLTANKYVLFY